MRVPRGLELGASFPGQVGAVRRASGELKFTQLPGSTARHGPLHRLCLVPCHEWEEATVFSLVFPLHTQVTKNLSSKQTRAVLCTRRPGAPRPVALLKA